MNLPPEVPEVVLLQELLTAEEVRAREAGAQAMVLRRQLEFAREVSRAEEAACADIKGRLKSDQSELCELQNKLLLAEKVSEMLRVERDEMRFEFEHASSHLRGQRDTIRELNADAEALRELDQSSFRHLTGRASQITQEFDALRLEHDKKVAHLCEERAESQRERESMESQLVAERAALRAENKALKQQLARIGPQSEVQCGGLQQEPESKQTALVARLVDAPIECCLVWGSLGADGPRGDHQEQLDRILLERDSLELRLNSVVSAQVKHEVAHANAKGEFASFQKRLARAETERDTLRQQLADTTAELDSFRRQWDASVIERDVISANRDALQQLLVNVTARIGDEKLELLRRCTDLEARLAADRERADYQQDALGEQYEIALAEAEARLEDVEADRAALLRQLADAAKGGSALQKQLAEMEERLAEMEVSAEHEALRWQLASARRAASARESELEGVMAQARTCEDLLSRLELQSDFLGRVGRDCLDVIPEDKSAGGCSVATPRDQDWKVGAQQRALDRVREWKRRAREARAKSCPERLKTWNDRQTIRPASTAHR